MPSGGLSGNGCALVPEDGPVLPPSTLHPAVVGGALLASAIAPSADHHLAVPADWGDLRRQLAIDALQVAGVPIDRIKICSRHVAAVAGAVAGPWQPMSGAEAICAVISVGDTGGEASLVEVDGNKISALQVEADRLLSSAKWEDRFIELLAEDFHRHKDLDPLRDRETRERWRASLRPMARAAWRRLATRGVVECQAAYRQTVIRKVIDRKMWARGDGGSLAATGRPGRQAPPGVAIAVGARALGSARRPHLTVWRLARTGNALGRSLGRRRPRHDCRRRAPLLGRPIPL